MCVLGPVLMDTEGPEGVPISNKMEKAKPALPPRGPRRRANAPSSLANCPTRWVPPSVSGKVGNPQAWDTFHVHQRVFAHLLCARRTCECAKILALAEPVFQWGWRGGETDKTPSEAYSVSEGNKDAGKENTV